MPLLIHWGHTHNYSVNLMQRGEKINELKKRKDNIYRVRKGKKQMTYLHLPDSWAIYKWSACLCSYLCLVQPHAAWHRQAALWTETNLLVLHPPLSHFQSTPRLVCGALRLCLMTHRLNNSQQVKSKCARSTHSPVCVWRITHCLCTRSQGEMFPWCRPSVWT